MFENKVKIRSNLQNFAGKKGPLSAVNSVEMYKAQFTLEVTF